MAEISKINLEGVAYDLKDTRARQPADVDFLGLVQSGGDVTIQQGIISVNDNSHNHKVNNISDLTASASEINILDGAVVKTAELNTLKGIDTTKTIQTHLNDNLATATVTGSPILLTDSAKGVAIDFNVEGRSTQKQGNFYDGELLQGVYSTGTGVFENSSVYVCNKNPKPCNSGDTIKIEYEKSTNIVIVFYDTNMAYITGVYGQAVSKYEYVAPSNAKYFNFDLGGANSAITPDTAGEITVTVNEATSYPSPTYPQVIKSNGDMGWFDGELAQGYYASNGSVTSYTGRISAKKLMPCSEGDEINLIYEEVADTLIIAFFKDNVWLSQVTANSVSELSGTVPSGANSFGITLYQDSITPTTAKHICVTINGMYALIVKNGNKNLLSVPSSITLSASGYVFVNKPVSLKANKTYTFSFVSSVTQGPQTQFVINYTDGTSQSLPTLSTTAGQKTTQTFTPTKDVISATYYSANAMTVTECMIEEGTVATDYVPHESKTTYIPISQPLRSSLDGSVADEVYKVDGKYIVERKFVERIFVGSDVENWSYDTNMGYAYTDILSNAKSNGSVISNCYINAGTGANNTILVNGNGLLIIYDNRFTSKDEWKVNLTTNPITVQYELATPTYEVLDQAPFYEMKTFDGVTLISSEAEMEVKYYKNSNNGNAIAELDSKIQNQITNINDEIEVLSGEVEGLGTSKVDKTTTINGKALGGNITLSASDVGADAKGSATSALNSAKSYTDTSIANLVDSAPETMNTLNELAEAIEEHKDVTDALNAAIGNKVDKVEGKGLSTNDYTTAEKIKLAGIAEGANKTIVDSALSSTSTNPVQNKIVTTALTGKADIVETTASTAAAAGWYRIAATVVSQENATAIFKVIAAASGYHTAAIITAGISYGCAPNIQVLQCSHYNTTQGISKARIVYHPSYNNTYAYLEVYKPATMAVSIAVSIIERMSWNVVAPSTAGSIPSGYGSKEISLTANAISAETFVGALSGNANTATKLATARTITLTGATAGSGSFDGSGNLSIATSGVKVPVNPTAAEISAMAIGSLYLVT